MKKWRAALSALIAAAVIGVCAGAAVGCGSCNNCGRHRHTYATEWSRDDVNHWHDATCEHIGEKADFGTHKDINNDGKCDYCGAILTSRSDGNNSGNQDGNHGENQGNGNKDEEITQKFGRVFEAAAENFPAGTKLETYKEGIKYGLYAETATDTDYFAATGNGFEQKLGTVGNKGVYISLALLKGNIEGSFEVSSDKMGSKWDIIQIKSDGRTVFAVRTSDDGDKFIKKFNDETENVDFSVAPKAGTVYKVTYKLTAGEDGIYKLTLTISDETFVKDFALGVKYLDSIYLTSSNAGSDAAKARLITIDDVVIDSVEMTVAEYRQMMQSAIDDTYVEMVGKAGTVVGTHTRNAAAIKAAYDAINLAEISETVNLRQEVTKFNSLKSSIDSDKKISAAIDGFFTDLACVKTGKSDDYAINRARFDSLIAEYEAADFASATDASVVAERFAEFEGKLALINSDTEEIGSYAEGKHTEISGYGAAELEQLDDKDLEEVIADVKSAAIAALTDGITVKDGYSNPTSPDYYKTVIDSRVAEALNTIRAKINDASKDLSDVKDDAETEYSEFVADAIYQISLNDSEFASELTAEVPALDLDGCEKAGAVAKALASAKVYFSTWLADKIASKEYVITVYATIDGENSGSVTAKYKYGEELTLEDLPDPTAERDDYLIDPDDGRYYTEKPFNAEKTFNGLDGIYSDYTLYVKIVRAAWAPEEQFTFSYAPLAGEYDLGSDDDQYALPAGVMKGVGNDFLTVAPAENGTVSWREPNRGYIENKNDGLIVNFIAGGKLIIKAASTGSSNVSRLGVKDSKGRWLEATNITGTASKVTAADPEIDGSAEEIGSYSFKNTSEITIEFTVPKAGVYTISCPSKVTNRGARIHSIIKVVDTHKVKAVAATGVTLQQTANLGIGNELKLNLAVQPVIAGYTAEWSSENTRIATVTGDGLVTPAETAEVGDTVKIKVRVTDVANQVFDRECTVRITDTLKVVVVYLTSLTEVTTQTWNNGWERDETLVTACEAYFKSGYNSFDIKYDNGTEDTSDDVTPVIAKAESATYFKFTLTKSANVTVYYTYNKDDGTKSSGFKVDGNNADWPAVSGKGVVAAKDLGTMTAGEHSLERAGEIGFCYMLVKEI